MSDMYYDPNTIDNERWLAAAEAYDNSDDYVSDAWDSLTSQEGPPYWLVEQLCWEYRGSGDWETKVQDRIDGER